jgi:predicted dithiol-disulfide oxidoreductase (DUF899 family)
LPPATSSSNAKTSMPSAATSLARAARVALGSGREGVHLRHGRGEEVPGRALRRALPAARLQHHVRAESAGACPGCSNLADHLDGGLVHLNHRDVTLSDFAFDFDLALTEEQMSGIDEIQTMLKEPPDWLVEWAEDVATSLEKGMAENPSWIAFALEDGVVYHTYTRMAPDRDFVVPYNHQLLDRTPKGWVDEFRAKRSDEYEDAAVGS